MTREEAANILDLKTRPEALADFVGPELAGIVHQAMIMGAEALRSPQPDPITGLVPCEACSTNTILPCSYEVQVAADDICQVEIDPKFCPECGRKLEVTE